MSDPASADPKALEVKYTYPDHEKDDAAIKKVEDAVAQRFSGSFQKGLEESAKDAPIKEEEARAKMAEAREQEAAEKASGSEEVKKELQDSPPPKPGAPVKPQVNAPNAPAQINADVKKGGKGGAAAKQGGKEGKPGAHAATKPVPAPPNPIVLRGASMSDAELDGYLNKYPSKAKETTETLSKIKEMSKVAESFDGKVEDYITNGDGGLEAAKGKLVNFLGKKEVSALFSKNPYANVEGGLGTLMQILSVVSSVASIVGNICSKLGLILTIVGLFGMIFPPIGAAVSAVARVLNIVGLLCDLLGLAVNGVLTALNGMVLAKQIAKGGSNEEKAATADMMVSEATSAGGHMTNLAMAYGPKFMKGFKSASKGVIGQLFKKFKTVVGKFATKTLGPVANWAKKIGYTFEKGLEKGAKKTGDGLLKKAWNSPGKALEKIRETSLVKKINNSKPMQWLERTSNSVNNSKVVKLGDATDKFAERLGEKAGKNVGAGANRLATKIKPDWDSALQKSIDQDIKATAAAAEKNAAKNAADREKAKIERDIIKNREQGNNKYVEARGEDGVLNDAKAAESRAHYQKADELEAGKADAIADAEKQGAKDLKEERKEAAKQAKQHEKAEAQEEARIEEFKKDPKGFQSRSRGYQTRLDNVEEKLNDPNLTEPERKKLQHTAHRLEETIAERRMIGMKAAGGEAPETLWDVRNTYKEGKESVQKLAGTEDEELDKDALKEKFLNEASGKDVKEAFEKDEQHRHITEWSEQTAPAPETAAQVDGLLAGLDDELGLEPDGDGDHDEAAQDAAADADTAADAAATADNAGGDIKDEPQQAQPAQNEAKADTEQVPDIPELAYWPKLTAPGGDFEQSAKDLHRMKQIAHAFYKSQVEAKKKALETAEGLGKSAEDATKKQEHAQQHTGQLQGTIDEAKTSAGAADQATGSTAKGEKAQGDSKGQAGNAPEKAPEPGEKPSRWHPIKRIWWYVKKWAADKAAKVFGWIQEKIASLVLRAICGVSMGDMKAYTTALNHRMQYSQLVGAQGVDAANKAMAEAAKTKTESKSYADQALDDAKECDQNMADADAFIKSVEATEQELVAEHARATQFLESLHAAVKVEKQRQNDEQAKKAAAAAGSAAASPKTAAPAMPAGPPGSAAAVWKKQLSQKPLSPSAVGKVKGAAGYVVSQANLLVEQLSSSRGEQMSRLKTVLEQKKRATREEFEKKSTGDGVIAELAKGVKPIVSAMEGVKNANPTAAPELKGLAGTIKGKAKDVDELAIHAHDALNSEFKSTYDAIARSA